jgi:ATP-dependent protease ClpP protease subunit
MTALDQPSSSKPPKTEPPEVAKAEQQPTPLYRAQGAARYERQAKIRDYEQRHKCRLVVLMDAIFPQGITLLEEVLISGNKDTDLNLLLYSPGGDGETAVRILRSIHTRCRKLTVIVPDRAKSAGTLIALGAHEIIMGPTSDLGPIDPQMQLPGKPTALVAAKDIIAAVDDAAAKIQTAPATYPLYAALLGDVTGILVQQAKSALGRSDDLLRLTLESCPSRNKANADKLHDALKPLLIDQAKTHAAIFGAKEAIAAGLPVNELHPSDPHWQDIWNLWTYYVVLNARVYECGRASQVFPWE